MSATTSSNNSSSSKWLSFFETTKYYLKNYLQPAICCLISIGIATLLLLGLVSYSDPIAKIAFFELKESPLTLNITTYVTNTNLFRGFNYTDGWIEVFYVPNNTNFVFSVGDATAMEVAYDYIQVTKNYQGPTSKNVPWKFTWPGDTHLNSPMDFTDLKANKSHFYVSLYMGYYYKILSWQTNTMYYQWLDTHVYGEYTTDDDQVGTYTTYHNSIPMKLSKDLSWSLSS